MPLTDAVIAELKAKHDTELHSLTTPLPGGDVVVVVRVPKPQVWKMVREMAAGGDPAKKVASNRILVNECVLYPAGDELAALMESRPALVDVWGGEIAELAGSVAGTIAKKL